MLGSLPKKKHRDLGQTAPLGLKTDTQIGLYSIKPLLRIVEEEEEVLKGNNCLSACLNPFFHPPSPPSVVRTAIKLYTT